MIIVTMLGAGFVSGCSSYEMALAGRDDSGVAGAMAEDAAGEGEAPGDADDGYGSESEEDILRLQPAATDAFVFVANCSFWSLGGSIRGRPSVTFGQESVLEKVN